jgi:hypothetical protein
MNITLSTLSRLVVAAACAAALAPAGATVVEPFTGGQLSAPGWSTPIGADASTYLGTPAPDNSYGIYLADATWSVNTSISFAAGETLRAWINPGPSPTADNEAQGGRLYLGFAASSADAYSFVAASDTGEIGFQNNTGYATPDFSTQVAQAYADQWYLMTIARSGDGTSATASLYGTDGSTLLNQVTATGLTSTANGIALRGTGGAVITTISVVPEPASYGLMMAGLLVLGLRARPLKVFALRRS